MQHIYHLMVDLSKCNPKVLKSKHALMAIIHTIANIAKMQLVEKAHFVVVNNNPNKYKNGLSAIQLIKTSNISIHCFQE